MEYRRTKNTVYACQYHVVFCPKYRPKVLIDGVDERFKQLAPEAARQIQGVEIVEMEVMPDHVHLLLEVPPQVSVGTDIRRIKGTTSRVLREEFPWIKKRKPTMWTNSYFCSTVGGAPLDKVKDYIQNQRTTWQKDQPGQQRKMG